MKKNRTALLLASAIALTAVPVFTACSDDDDDDGKVEDVTVQIDELLKASDSTVKLCDSGVGNLLDDYRNIIKELSQSNDADDMMELDYYKQRLQEIEAYCEHKSDSVKEADPAGYQHALDSLKALDPANSLMAGIGQMFGTYGWAVLSYMDVGADGKRRRMSALAIFPRNAFCNLNAEHVILCPHWTIASDGERPTNYVEAESLSYKSDNSNVMAGEWAAFDEYLVIMPDYEGYGESKDVSHPYLIREVQARQCIIALLRGIGWFTSNTDLWGPDGHGEKIDKDYKIVIEGYSQGGAVSAATYRYFLEHQGEAWAKNLPIAGAVCGDGPHDPFATLTYYCTTNYVEMPVAPAMVLKGLCDYDPEMIAAKCTPADFCNPGFINSGIFEAIASKNNNTDQCSAFVYKYAKEHPDEIKLRDDGGLSADQMLTPAAYNYFATGKLIKGANYQKLAILKKCLQKNSVAYNFTPPPYAHFTFFHSEGDRVVPYDNYQSMKKAWGTGKLRGVTYKGEGKESHLDVGTIFFKSYHSGLVGDIIDGDWKSGEETKE
jgi:pimeloyl-ACP methyl ester carboxylesterase